MELFHFTFLLIISLPSYSYSSLSLINITCSHQPVILHTKEYLVDLSWLEYIQEIKELNQRYNYSFLLYSKNENVDTYIKTASSSSSSTSSSSSISSSKAPTTASSSSMKSNNMMVKKNKKNKVIVKGFDQLPREMRAYGHNVWMPVKRKQPSALLQKENFILHRSTFYEGY